MIRAVDLCGVEFHHELEDVATLKELVGMLPDNPVIVNIGACFGTSALAMMEARPDAFIFSIDIKPSEKEREHLEASNVDPNRVVRVLGRSQEVGLHWPHTVDFVFVDGGHSRKDVIGDIEAWLPKAKGIIA